MKALLNDTRVMIAAIAVMGVAVAVTIAEPFDRIVGDETAQAAAAKPAAEEERSTVSPAPDSLQAVSADSTTKESPATTAPAQAANNPQLAAMDARMDEIQQKKQQLEARKAELEAVIARADQLVAEAGQPADTSAPNPNLASLTEQHAQLQQRLDVMEKRL